MMYKIVHNLVEINLGDSIQLIVNSITRGHSKRIKVPMARLNCRAHFFVNRVASVWNHLSESTVSANSVFMFKQNVFDRIYPNF